MPEFAQFFAIMASDRTIVLPDPQTQDTDVSFRNIDLPDLDRTRTALILFKVKGSTQGGPFLPTPAHLRMRFNSGNEHLISVTFGSEPAPRTWHEIFPGEDLQASNNELTVSVESTPLFLNQIGGRIELSDIVIFYHAKTPG